MSIALGSISPSDVRVGANQANRVIRGISLAWPYVSPQVSGTTTPGSQTLYFPRHHDLAKVLLVGGGGGGGGSGWVINGDGGEAGKRNWMTGSFGGSVNAHMGRSPYPDQWIGWIEEGNHTYYWFVPADFEHIPVTIGAGGGGGRGAAISEPGSPGQPTTLVTAELPIYVYDRSAEVWRRTERTGNFTSSAAGGQNNAMSGTRNGEEFAQSRVTLSSGTVGVDGEEVAYPLHPAASQGEAPGAGGRGGTASSGNGSAGGNGGAFICSYSAKAMQVRRRVD